MFLLDTQEIDALFLQKERIRRKRYDTIEGVADTEQQSNADKRRRPHARGVENECDTVIDRIRHHRFKQHIVRFAEPIEGGVKHVLNSVQNVESNEYQHQFKKFIHVGETEHVRHKRFPHGNAHEPQHRDDRRDSEIAKRVLADILLIGCHLLLNEFSELEHGQKNSLRSAVSRAWNLSCATLPIW